MIAKTLSGKRIGISPQLVACVALPPIPLRRNRSCWILTYSLALSLGKINKYNWW